MHGFPSLPHLREHLHRPLFGLLLVGVLGAFGSGLAHAGVVVVAHAGVRKLDATQVQRIFTGRVVQLGGQVLLPVNYPPGNLLRQRFLNDYLQQDEDGYTAYWTVRRYVGKGVPPRELTTTGELILYACPPHSFSTQLHTYWLIRWGDCRLAMAADQLHL